MQNNTVYSTWLPSTVFFCGVIQKHINTHSILMLTEVEKLYRADLIFSPSVSLSPVFSWYDTKSVLSY